jgi:FtsZ-interacting cell division protein ZipA
MDTSLLVILLIVLVLLVVLALVASRQMRSRRLREKFGPEYDRTVTEAGDRKQAESQLQERTERRQQLDIVPLDPADRDRYVEAWRQTQARFVDEPAEATREADRLITDVMRKRGYPIDDFEQRAADISVDHPQVVDDYRAAQAIAAANERSEASTEDLRQALVHYRSLFEELLEVGRTDDRTDDDRQPYDGRADTQAEEAR